MNLIWATRGRSWGFRFLLYGGRADPLPTYESAFAGTEGERTVFRSIGELVAVRFPDPDGRRDDSGRVIPHDIVLLTAPAEVIRTIEDARELAWPLIADAFARLWDLPGPPSRDDVRRALRSGPSAASSH